ncbi:MAG: multidrug efflux SMR transporter [Microbacteriaceae bacterium]|nr:multidrug efflux SMR transporter [Microbacteriaceae bacterium]
MAWIILIASGVLESVWASALGASDNFRRPKPTVLFAVSLVLSMAGLAYAMTDIPVGTAYAVWVGIGAVLTVVIAVARKKETLSLGRAALLVALVGCIIGLKVVS